MTQIRRRGVVLTELGKKRLERAISSAQEREKYGQCFTQIELEDRTGLSRKTIKKIFTGSSQIDESSLKALFKAFGLELESADYGSPNNTVDTPFPRLSEPSCDNRVEILEAPEVPIFCGRRDEISLLKKWIIDHKCKLIIILGMGGIGKTSLSVELIKQLKHNFKTLVWKSLQEKPKFDEILISLDSFLDLNKGDHSNNIEHKIKQFMLHLKSRRSLVILDNLESILKEDKKVGGFQQGYTDYESFFREFVGEEHDSCLIITSREKPKEIAFLEGEHSKIRSFQLSGLNAEDTKKIFSSTGKFSGSNQDWETLNRNYAGNPLAMKMLATSIRDLVDGDLSEFIENTIKQDLFNFNDIEDILARQFERLSDTEKKIMYWLCIERDFISISELIKAALFPLNQKIWEGLKFLQWRSLIEKKGDSASFTLQPVIKAYTCREFTQTIFHEICSRNLNLFKTHPLLKATAKENIRAAQKRTIVSPLLDMLISHFKGISSLKLHLIRIKDDLQKQDIASHGYAAGNLLNLILSIKPVLEDCDFSNLSIRQAFLQNKILRHVDFSGACFSDTVFTQNFSSVLSVDFSSDGRKLAFSDSNGRVYIWDFDSDQQIHRFSNHENWV
jgi:transcriptional regulator with XRE-family HTH domain